MKIHNFYTLWTKNNIKAAKCSDHQKYCSEFENSQNGRFGFDVFILKSENTVQCKNYKTKSKKHNLQVIQTNWTKKKYIMRTHHRRACNRFYIINNRYIKRWEPSMLSGPPSQFHHLLAGFVHHHESEYVPGVGELLDLVVGVFVGVIDSLGFGVEPVTGNLLLTGKSSGSGQEFRGPAESWSLHRLVSCFRWHIPELLRISKFPRKSNPRW